MRMSGTGCKSLMIVAVLGISGFTITPASAHGRHNSGRSTHVAAAHGSVAHAARKSRSVAEAHSGRGGHARFEARAGRGLVRFTSYNGRHGGFHTSGSGYGGVYANCVAFVREETGMDLSGNAWAWWPNAVGLYERGNQPEVGAVMSFTANPHMRSGHVAVVSRVVNARMVEIDQSNWMGGGISRGTAVMDVSPNNDWTAVRVGLGRSGNYGSVYPINGFIYDRADHGGRLLAHPTNVSLPALNPPPRDLRSAAQREAEITAPKVAYDEVAEAPATPSH